MIQPQSATLLPGGSQQFTSPNATRWAIAPQLGVISGTGLYTAPKSLWLSRTVDVVALDGDQEIARATVNISSSRNWMFLLGLFWACLSVGLLGLLFLVWPGPPAPPSVAVYPPVVTLHVGDIFQFLSSSAGAGAPAVLWTASEGGQITPSGVFTALADPGGKPITVTVTRDSDRAQTATAQVIISEAKLVMARSVANAAAMKPGGTIDFEALGPNGPEKPLQWFLSGPGTLSDTGRYTVRDKSASQAIVTAVDPTSARKAAVVVRLADSDSPNDARLLLLVLLMGAFGALLGAMRSFVNYVGSRTFAPSWGFYYLSRPVFGGGLALIVFFGYRIGALTAPQGATPADPFAAAFIAGIVGLFADTFLQKLQELVIQLFRPADARADKMGAGSAPPPAIATLAVDQGALTVTGSNFAAGATVSVNGAVLHPVVTPTKLTLALPATLGQKGTELHVVVLNPDGAKSSVMSVTV